jgi:hypothetical protein
MFPELFLMGGATKALTAGVGLIFPGGLEWKPTELAFPPLPGVVFGFRHS